jgi:hypothetical protein
MNCTKNEFLNKENRKTGNGDYWILILFNSVILSKSAFKFVSFFPTFLIRFLFSCVSWLKDKFVKISEIRV